LHLVDTDPWSEYIDTHFFALGFADVVASGEAKELAQGGIELLETAFSELMEYVEENSSVDIQSIIRAVS
jgi:hypothetical protein